MNSFYQRYLLPGLVFQGVVIGGGYATGRELVEFFLPHGPIGGLFAMGLAALVWSLVMAASFELCRVTQSYDYKTFFTHLLGRFWVLYEILLLLLMLVILAVVGAAAGEISHTIFNISPLIGTIGLLIVVGLLTFYGSHIIERFMGAWSMLLYASFFALVVLCFTTFGENITHNYQKATIGTGWALDGIRYAGYNLASVPMIFFCLTHITKRKEAIGAGLLAGFVSMSPAVFLFVAMMGQYPQIGNAAIPSTELLSYIGSPFFSLLFQVVLLGTLVQTGIGLVHSVNERIATTLEANGKTMPKTARPVVAILLLLSAIAMASYFGIIALIAKGYGLLTFGFIAVFVVPVLTIGIYKSLQFAKNAYTSNQ